MFSLTKAESNYLKLEDRLKELFLSIEGFNLEILLGKSEVNVLLARRIME